AGFVGLLGHWLSSFLVHDVGGVDSAFGGVGGHPVAAAIGGAAEDDLQLGEVVLGQRGDLHEHSLLRVHDGGPEILGVHLAQALAALDADVGGTVGAQRGDGGVAVVVVDAVDAVPAPGGDDEQRRGGDVDHPGVD